MATQKRLSRGTTKKSAAKTASGRKRAGLKTAPARRKRATASTTAPKSTSGRRGGVIKRAIKKGISELAKVGS